ncbi:MAG: molybdopterin converting factor subunit 1 [Rhodospirillaceae bacterium]|nr:molybdopterin converting factor subunit 1 [Rhodospirillaceae bacterium]
MNILYFAWVREKVGAAEETVSPPPTVGTLGQLIDWLAQRSPRHAAAFADRKLIRAAIDQVHSQINASVAGAKEVAFFPPVTGG